MTEKEIRKVCEEYLPRYEKAGKKVSLKYLGNIIEKATKSAEENYQSLKDPKTCGLKSYVDYYLKEEVLADFIYKTFPKKNISDQTNTNPLAIAIYAYLKILPLGAQSSYAYFWKGIYKLLKKEGEDSTQKSYLPFLKKAEEPYVKIVRARNQPTKKQGYKNFIDFHLVQTAKISPKEYQFFLKNKDRVIKFCQGQIPKVKLPTWFYSQFNNYPCFLCELPTFPKIDFPSGVMKFVAEEHPILKKFQDKIKIKEVNSTNTEYVKKTDSFIIRSNKEINKRHQVSNLIHKLSHVNTL